jgi:hypothetical protein
LFTVFLPEIAPNSSLCRHLSVTRGCESFIVNLIAHWDGFESISIGASVLTVGRGALAQAVFQAADATDWPKPTRTENSVPAAVLRSVLLYCLATNICPSQEIVEASESDPAVKYLCANHELDWQTVHEFRKRNSGLMREALTNIFQSVSSVSPLAPLKRIAHLEADVRIRRAVQADSIVLDL